MATFVLLLCARGAVAGPNCSEVSSSLIFRGVSVIPPQPQVGDEVQVTFDTEFLVYAVEAVTLNTARQASLA